jgi:DNA (cytosine-5)-methyltransferase 1
MPVYTCEKCGKEFKYSSALKRHMNRKTPCKKVVEEDIVNIDIVNKNNTKLKYIDLFCGIGGFHIALDKLGHKCVMACDIDKYSREVYKKNFNIYPSGNIRNIDEKKIDYFDILTGGFPCQTFSNAGKKKGINDENKGTLFNEIIRIVKYNKPKFIFLENVKHIKKIDNGNVFKIINNKIEECGYNVFHIMLSPHELGIPQQRERIFFICIRNDIYNIDYTNIIINNINNKRNEKKIDFNNFFEKKINKKYFLDDKIKHVLNIWDEIINEFDDNEKLSPTILCKEFFTNYTDDEFKELPLWKKDYITKNKYIYNKYKSKWDIWWNKYKNILLEREIYCKLEWQAGKKKNNDSIWDYFIQLRQSGIRVKKKKYFPTLVAIVQTPIYGKEKRYITPRECAKLQSFPDNFIIDENDNKAYKQFGNAVNVNVVYTIIQNVLHTYGYK